MAGKASVPCYAGYSATQSSQGTHSYILTPSSIVVIPASLSFAGVLNPLNIFSSSLEVVLLLLNPILDVFIRKDLDAIVICLIGVLVRKDLNFLKLFIRDLAVVF
jgi:hypothetical protein